MHSRGEETQGEERHTMHSRRRDANSRREGTRCSQEGKGRKGDAPLPFYSYFITLKRRWANPQTAGAFIGGNPLLPPGFGGGEEGGIYISTGFTNLSLIPQAPGG